MQEVAPHVYIDTTYTGVTLGAISWPRGLILIDAPLKADDARSWKAALLNLGSGVDRLLVNLDAHLDRTLGVRGMECTVLGHEKMVQVFRNRPVTFKAQPIETGAEWELQNGLGSIRWTPPEITFTSQLSIHWDETPLEMFFRPGPSPAAIWVVLPGKEVVFVGDSVTLNQPPFLSSSNIPLWIEQLNVLLTPEYQNSLIISGRGGVVTQEDVRKQVRFLEKVSQIMEGVKDKNSPQDELDRQVSPLLALFQPPAELAIQYQNRLRYGLRQYYLRNYRPTEVQEADD
jgi:glyoxylase-like metal-dependent hydrolase (beta-lactamase superfamily II)